MKLVSAHSRVVCGQMSALAIMEQSAKCNMFEAILNLAKTHSETTSFNSFGAVMDDVCSSQNAICSDQVEESLRKLSSTLESLNQPSITHSLQLAHEAAVRKKNRLWRRRCWMCWDERGQRVYQSSQKYCMATGCCLNEDFNEGKNDDVSTDEEDEENEENAEGEAEGAGVAKKQRIE